MCFFKRFRCLNAENLGSVGQRAAKLLAVKVGGLKKKSSNRPRSNHSQTLTASNFEALKFKDFIFTVSKDLNLLKKYI